MNEKVVKSDAGWKKELSPEQYRVLREHGTERAFTGALWNNHDAGTYLCAGCGLELFGSDAKFESGTGWPSLYAPINAAHVGTTRRPEFLHAAHGGPLCALRRTPGPCLRRRPPAHRAALLHQLGGVEV
jgi:hypothetical protein